MNAIHTDNKINNFAFIAFDLRLFHEIKNQHLTDY